MVVVAELFGVCVDEDDACELVVALASLVEVLSSVELELEVELNTEEVVVSELMLEVSCELVLVELCVELDDFLVLVYGSEVPAK